MNGCAAFFFSLSLSLSFFLFLQRAENTFVALPAAYCEALIGDFPLVLSLSWCLVVVVIIIIAVAIVVVSLCYRKSEMSMCALKRNRGGDKRLNVAWMGDTIQKNYGDLSIEIPHALGVGAGLQQGTIVSATLLNSVPPAAKIVLKVG